MGAAEKRVGGLLQHLGGRHPEVQEALDGAAPDKFTVMRHLDRVEFTPFDEEQFEFVLGIILDGLERRIAR